MDIKPFVVVVFIIGFVGCLVAVSRDIILGKVVLYSSGKSRKPLHVEMKCVKMTRISLPICTYIKVKQVGFSRLLTVFLFTVI